VTLGSIEDLRATKQLATTTRACPSWCDGEHELTCDDRGISHHCAIEDCDSRRSLGVHLRAKEPVDAPGTLGPTRLVVYSDDDQPDDHGWFIEIPVDAERLQTLRNALNAALLLIEHQNVGPAPQPVHSRS
jgi:hypothetical protein